MFYIQPGGRQHPELNEILQPMTPRVSFQLPSLGWRELFAIWIVGASFTPIQGQTRPPSVELGGVNITIGMPADKLLATLRGKYTVLVFDDKPPLHHWLVSNGPVKDNEPFGLVNARGNTVVGISKLLLEHVTDSTQDIFDALFDASSKFEEEGRNRCTATTSTGYVPGPATLNNAAVSFTCEPYRLIIIRNALTTTDDKPLVGYRIYEKLGATD
jgi:hypothetical protein